MNKGRQFLSAILIVILFISSCDKGPGYVVETNIKDFFPEDATSLNDTDLQHYFHLFHREAFKNTVGKKLPQAEVRTLDGKKMDLRKLCEGETIIIASDAYCPVGWEVITREFRESIDEADPSHTQFKIICLLLENEADKDEPESFQRAVTAWSSKYENFFLMDTIESRKINADFFHRLYINEDQLITFATSGLYSGTITILKEIENRDIGCATFEEWEVYVSGSPFLPY